MLDVINLALPFFGLIFLGYVCGKLKPIPDAGLAWMNFFLIYVALPALFYRILAKTPFEQLANIPFIVATTLATFCAFTLAFAAALIVRHGKVRPSVIAALAGSYGNIGYMGPGLALTTLGAEAAVPVALIFCFDNILLFSLAPLLLALSDSRRKSLGAAALDVAGSIASNPLIIATAAGVAAAALRFEPPVALDRLLLFLQNAAAPCALFALGVTVAQRVFERTTWDVPLVVLVKLVVHPAAALLLLSALGPQPQAWLGTAVLMAALPPALNVFIIARQYDEGVAQASSAVLLGTVLSVVTLTTVMWLVKRQQLPHALFD
ncbi:MAG: AEC family transporter [Variibacter sp.]|nr:AEC family transporter [Variibacter sp.]